MIHIVLITDAQYVVPTGVTLASIARHVGPDAPVHAHVLAETLDPLDRQRLVEMTDVEGLHVEFTEVDASRVSGLASDVSYITNASFQRFFLHDYLPDLDRVIYLDGDVLVRSSLRGLWEHDLDHRLAGGVRDGSIPFLSAPGSVEDWRALGVDPRSLYCNTGVMLIDLERWRLEERGQGLVDYVERHGGTVRLGDQGALNASLKGAWSQLDPTWNVQTEFFDENNLVAAFFEPETIRSAVEDPRIVHFTGYAKPWRRRCDHPFAAEWTALLAETPFAGWPPAPASSSKRRIPGLSRLRRAASVLVRG